MVARAERESAARLAEVVERADRAAERLAEAQRALDVAGPDWARAQRERDRWQELESERKLAERGIEALTENAGRVARELATIGEARQELDALRVELVAYPTLMQDLQGADALYREDGRRQSMLDHERAVVEELARLDERLAKSGTAPGLEATIAAEGAARRVELTDLQTQAEARRTVWVRDLEEARTKLKSLAEQHKEVRRQREQLVTLGPDGECPTCARPLGDHLASVLALLDDQIDALAVNGRYFKERVKQLTQPPAEVSGGTRWR